MKFIQRGPDPRTPAQKQMEDQMLVDGIFIGALLMNLYFSAFGDASRTVKVIGAGFPLLILILNFVSGRRKKGNKK